MSTAAHRSKASGAPVLHALDLALVRAFVALVTEQSVSRAAEALGQSQPQLSGTLRRMRALFHDPILVRGSGGMVATDRALSLLETARRMLADGQTLLSAPDGVGVDPLQLHRLFQIALPDFISAPMVTQVFLALRQAAPGCRLAVLPVRGPGEGVAMLESGQVDLLIDASLVEAGHIRHTRLFDDPFVMVGAADHPAFQAPLSLDDYLALPHLAAAPGSGVGPGLVDRLLLERGLTRRVVGWVPYLNAAAPLLTATDMLLTTGSRLARHLALQADLRVAAPPVALEPLHYALMWHERVHGFAEHRWLRQLVKKALEGTEIAPN